MATEQKGFLRWFLSYFLTTEHFKNSIALMIVVTYCVLMLIGRTPINEFSLLIGMVLGAYFKRSE